MSQIDTSAKTISDWQLYKRLLAYVAAYWQTFLISLLAMAILSATSPLLAALLKPTLDEGFVAQNAELLLQIPFLLIALFTIRAAASFASVYALNWVANRVVMDLRQAMFDRLLRYPARYFDQHHTGGVISRFTFDVIQIKEACTNAITVIFRDSLTMAGLFAWMLYLNWQMTIVVVAVAPFIVIVVNVIRRRLRRMSRKIQESMSSLQHVLSEVINAHRLVKIFGAQVQESERFQITANDNRRFNMKFAAASAASSPAVELITAIALAIIIYVAGRQALVGELSVGAFVSFFGALAMIMGPVKRLVRINEHIQRGLAGCESVFSLLDAEIESDAAVTTPIPIRGDINIKGLSLSYEQRAAPALHDVHLQITAGETVAIVGSSGSGKSTLANLIPRIYESDGGELFIDGRDVREIPLGELRRNVSYVSQEIVLFDATVRNNIAYGDCRSASDDEIVAAAEAAYAMEFIVQLPHGLDTPVGQHGARLSGGQRQRIALARALLKQAPILILDEATSSLDPDSESKIQQALAKIRRSCTCIIIAHRPSTIEAADRIIVLDGGRIVESGTHKELIQRGGVYAQLHARPN